MEAKVVSLLNLLSKLRPYEIREFVTDVVPSLKGKVQFTLAGIMAIPGKGESITLEDLRQVVSVAVVWLNGVLDNTWAADMANQIEPYARLTGTFLSRRKVGKLFPWILEERDRPLPPPVWKFEPHLYEAVAKALKIDAFIPFIEAMAEAEDSNVGPERLVCSYSAEEKKFEWAFHRF